MSSPKASTLRPLQPGSHSAAQQRIVDAALDLFGEHGVSGTSLQMIADAIGVSKAAVYHQFNTKDEIVIAAAEFELLQLEAALDAAEAEPSRAKALDMLLTRVIDLAVKRRRMVRFLQHDPVVVRFLAEHEPFRQLMNRLFRALTGNDDGADARVPAAMLSAAIGGAVMHPLVVDLDDDTLRAELLKFTRRLLGVESPA